jgi:hypothetical protein
LIALRDFAKAENKPIYFIAIPSPFQVSGSYFSEFSKIGFVMDDEMLTNLKPQSEFGSICSRNNFSCFDISQEIINSPEKELLYWPRDEHFRPAGYVLAADLIYAEVYPQLTLNCQ